VSETRQYLYGFRTDYPVAREEWNISWGQMCDVIISLVKHHCAKTRHAHSWITVRCVPDKGKTELMPLSMGGGYGHRICVEIVETVPGEVH